jgi:hypothetical protein
MLRLSVNFNNVWGGSPPPNAERQPFWGLDLLQMPGILQGSGRNAPDPSHAAICFFLGPFIAWLFS